MKTAPTPKKNSRVKIASQFGPIFFFRNIFKIICLATISFYGKINPFKKQIFFFEKFGQTVKLFVPEFAQEIIF